MHGKIFRIPSPHPSPQAGREQTAVWHQLALAMCNDRATA